MLPLSSYRKQDQRGSGTRCGLRYQNSLVLYGARGMGTPEASVWGCPRRGKALGHSVGGGAATEPFPKPLPAPVAEKTKEQASHLGGAVFSGAGNIAAATGLVKKEEFPTDLKASALPARVTHTGHTCLPPSTPPAWGTSLLAPLPTSLHTQLKMNLCL